MKKACETAGIEFNDREAHSAEYDTRKTAELFCDMVNRWKKLGGWPLVPDIDDFETQQEFMDRQENGA